MAEVGQLQGAADSSAAYALFTVDNDGTITSWERSVESILGYREDEFIGRDLATLFTPADCASDEPRRELSGASSAKSVETHRQLVRRDGTLIWTDGVVSATGNGFLKVIRNCTRDKSDLEQFASVASHDMSEPLRMINSYLGLLKRKYGEALDANGQEYIAFAVDGCRRMRDLLDMLFDYSRAHQARRAFGWFNSDAALRRAENNLAVAIAESKARLSYGALPRVWGDSVQLVQLFQNLIGNAIKYQPPGGVPEIFVEAIERPTHWEFSVRDNGIGIDAEFATAVFEPFRRLHNREAYPGTGLGLAVCAKIVERHQGRIWVESRAGEGATFHFTIAKGEPDR